MKFQPGDIAACYGSDFASRVISWGTASLFGPGPLRIGPSHVAIIVDHPRRDLLTWCESTSLCRRPCLEQGTAVDGCQAHRPEDRIDDYLESGGSVDIYRLAAIQSLSTAESELLTRIVWHHLIEKRVHYDLRGAILSGTRLLKRTHLFPGADLDSLFCSEWIAAVLQRLGRMNHANPARFHPAGLLRELVDTGVYQRVEVPHLRIMEVSDAA